VQQNHTISASFSTNGPFTITATSDPGGSITPGGDVSVACGADQVFTIAPSSDCFSISDVIVDDVPQGAISTYTFTNVQSSHQIQAVFSALGPYAISASAGVGGKIVPKPGTLAPGVWTDFDGPPSGLPGGWASFSWTGGTSQTDGNGNLIVNGSRANPNPY